MNWNELETSDCNQCGADQWTRFHSASYEDDIDEIRDSSDVEMAHFECDSCGAHARVFAENGSVQRTGAMR